MKSHCKLLSVLAVIAYSFVGPGSANAQTGPVAYWPFNESSDTVLIDSSGNVNTAYIHSATRVLGVSGNALSFNGTSDYAYANNSATLNMSNQLSIECWVNTRLLASNQTIIRKENCYVFGIGAGGKIGFSVHNLSGWNGTYTLSQQSLLTSTWYHVAGVWDGSVMKVYVNGVADPNTYAATGTMNSDTNKLYIGEFFESYKERLNGVIDELKVYNYALSPDTIAAHYITTNIVPELIPYTPNPTYNRRPQFRWYSNTLIPVFMIQIATNNQFSSLIDSAAMTDTFYTPVKDLPFGTIYWRVGNNADTAACTAPSSFYITDSTTKVIKNWTVVTPPPTSNNLRCIAYGNGQYVAVGDSGTIITSPDGITWTSRTSGITTRLWSVTYGNHLYVTVGDSGGGSGRILTSANGITWTKRVSGTTNNLVSLTYGNGKYLAGGEGHLGNGHFNYSDSESMRISSDGITWSRDTTIGLSYSSGIALAYLTYSNGLYVVLTPRFYYQGVSHGGDIYFDCDIVTSSDCKNWTTHWTTPITIFPESELLTSVTYGNGRWVAVGQEPDGIAVSPANHNATSVDGITWDSGSAFENVGPNSITYGNGEYVAVGDGGGISTSPDGLTDTINISGTTANLNSVTYGNGAFVAVGNNGTIIISSSTTAVKPVQKSSLLASALTVQARNSLLTISLPSAMLGKAVDLAVYSVSGREIMRKRVQSGAERVTVPVGFSYGSYILVANDGSRKASVRFVALR